MKNAAVINDISGFGRCSLVADISVMTAMGISPCPIPTAVLTGQTEYEDYFMRDMSGDLPEYLRVYGKMNVSFDGILTGFMTSTEEAHFAENFISKFSKSGTIVLVDPVMADDGEVYENYSDDLLGEMKKLLDMADIITPNLSELALLTGRGLSGGKSGQLFKGRDEIISAAGILAEGDRTVVVTGIKENENIVNLVVNETAAEAFPMHRTGGHFSGSGDLLAAAVLSGRMNKMAYGSIMTRFENMFGAAAEDAARSGGDGNDGIPYEKYLGMLMP